MSLYLTMLQVRRMSPPSWVRTGPASLEMVSGGILAEWLLRGTSVRRMDSCQPFDVIHVSRKDFGDARIRNLGSKPSEHERAPYSSNEFKNIEQFPDVASSVHKNPVQFSEEVTPRTTEYAKELVSNKISVNNHQVEEFARKNVELGKQIKNQNHKNIPLTSDRLNKAFTKEHFEEKHKKSSRNKLSLKLNETSTANDIHDLTNYSRKTVSHIIETEIIHFDGTGTECLKISKECVETRARSYLNVINEVMPIRIFHATLQKSLLRLMFGLCYVENKKMSFSWISDLLTILTLCDKTDLNNIHLNFHSSCANNIIQILNIIRLFNLEKSVSKISLQKGQDQFNSRQHCFDLSFEIPINSFIANLPSMLESFGNLRSLRLTSTNRELLEKLRDLRLISLSLLSPKLKNSDIVNHFLGYQLDGVTVPCIPSKSDISNPLFKSLKSLHVPNCYLSLTTYSLLIQTLSNVADLKVKPKLIPYGEEPFKLRMKTSLNLKYLSLSCDELPSCDFKSKFPLLENVSVHFYNTRNLQNITAINQLERLNALELYSYPCSSNYYCNMKLEEAYPHMKISLERISSLTFQNFDISVNIFNLLSELPYLSTITFKNCWINAQKSNSYRFRSLKEVHLNSMPSNSVITGLFSSGGIQHLSIIPSEDSAQESHLTEMTLRKLLASGKLASLSSLSCVSLNLSPSFIQQLTLLPRLEKFIAIDQCGMSSDEMRTCISTAPAHITLCSGYTN